MTSHEPDWSADLIAPDLIQELHARVDTFGSREEETKQTKFRWPEFDILTRDRCAVSGRIEPHRADLEHFLCGFRCAPPQHCFHPRLQFARAERLLSI